MTAIWLCPHCDTCGSLPADVVGLQGVAVTCAAAVQAHQRAAPHCITQAWVQVRIQEDDAPRPQPER